MAMYGYVWLCIAMYGYVRLCMVMYSYVWLCMAIYGCIWLYIVMYGCVGLCRAMSRGGVLPEKLDRGVQPASQNPYPIYPGNLTGSPSLVFGFLSVYLFIVVSRLYMLT